MGFTIFSYSKFSAFTLPPTPHQSFSVLKLNYSVTFLNPGRHLFRNHNSIVIAGSVRPVFKWLSKVITPLRLLRAVIGFKISSQLFSQWEAKSKPIITYTRDLSRALRKLQVVAQNSDSFIVQFAPAMWSDYFLICFSIVILKTL